MLTSRSVRYGSVAVAAASVLALVLSACSSGKAADSGSPQPTSGSSSTSTSPSGSSVAPSTTASVAPKTPVHIKTLNSDGVTYGVGMPVIVFFSKKITSAKAFQNATTVTVNGKAAKGAWYFETSAAEPKKFPFEAHLRLQDYWPAHSAVHVGMLVKGLSAGGNMAFDNSLTLDFNIGARNISTVDASSHQITVTSDGQTTGTYPVSLGADSTPTRSGIKVIMEKLKTVCMHDIAGTYYECGIKWDQRLTYDGEYLHAAPWNLRNIGSRDTSNGCTNLKPADAITLYSQLNQGDVVLYPNANGSAMQLGNGFGDWNVDWGVWQAGGLVSTTV